jgi:predicted nucleic acid-binding protein
LIDTSVLVDVSRNRQNAVTFLTALSGHGPPPVSIIAAMELLVGARNARDLATLQSFLQSYFVTVPVTDTVSRRTLGLIEQFTLSHGLEVADALIAATALELSLPLYTMNVRHFQMIPGLTPLRPY